MGCLWKMAPLGAAAFFLSACVTYPYSANYTSCDQEAGACYRYCEQYADTPGDYQACHVDCDAGANQCFAATYDQYRYSPAYARYGYGASPWYGRYGSWYPNTGYAFSFNYYGGGHGYSHPRRRPHGGHGGGRDHGNNAPPRRRLDGDGEQAPVIRNSDDRPNTRRGPDPSVQERQFAPQGQPSRAPDPSVQERAAPPAPQSSPPPAAQQRTQPPPRRRTPRNVEDNRDYQEP